MIEILEGDVRFFMICFVESEEFVCLEIYNDLWRGEFFFFLFGVNYVIGVGSLIVMDDYIILYVGFVMSLFYVVYKMFE